MFMIGLRYGAVVDEVNKHEAGAPIDADRGSSRAMSILSWTKVDVTSVQGDNTSIAQA